MSESRSLSGEITPTSRAPWRRIAEAWAAGISHGQLRLAFPDGSARVFVGAEPGPSAALQINSPRAVRRMILGGELGFAEAFMDGDWTTPDLTALVEFGLVNQESLDGPLRIALPMRIISAIRHRLNANTRRGAKRNIAYHYDLGNDFYSRWLDETMTYSSAIFEQPEMTLAAAQRAKYRKIIERLGLQPGDKVLEIGCGWGGFAEEAAKAGAEMTCLTISQEQADYARKRMADAGLAEHVDIRLQDYRDVEGTFDRIVSIEMFEAVGEENWPAYFDVVRDRLRAGGTAVLQIITIANERFAEYRRSVDFIQRYIFPGGMLPSPATLADSISAAGLKLAGSHFFALSYAETLKQWAERFMEAWPDIERLGFDTRFQRMWRYYLHSCEGCFRRGATDVGQFVIERS